MRIILSSKRSLKRSGGRPPPPVASAAIRVEGLGFLHIPRTGGTYLSRKTGLGIYDPIFAGGNSLWHRIPTADILRQRKTWFTVVRNPYHRIYSEIRWRKKQNDLDWFRVLKVPPEDHFCLQISLAQHVENWIRYENLPHEFNLLMRSAGYPEVDFSDWRASRAEPLHEFDDLIREKYSSDFERLGYEK